MVLANTYRHVSEMQAPNVHAVANTIAAALNAWWAPTLICLLAVSFNELPVVAAAAPQAIFVSLWFPMLATAFGKV